MIASRRARVAAAGTVIMLGCLTAACSSSGSKASGTGGPSGAGLTAGGNGLTGGAPGVGIDAKYCSALKLSDAQKLLKPTIAAAKTGGSETCAFVLPGQSLSGDNLTVTVNPLDNDKSFYNEMVGIGGASSPAHTVPGVSGAVWVQVVPGTAPQLVARDGNTTCVVQPPDDATTLTIGEHGSTTGALGHATDADAAAYATEMAPLCTEALAVKG
jgi:hypothetical protein